MATALLFSCSLHAADGATTMFISDAWMRASLGEVRATAAYLKIENRGAKPDRLMSISTPVAATAQVHDSAMRDGMMRMTPAEPLIIKPGQSVQLSPGGLHVMVMGLKAPLRAGQSAPMILHFEQAGPVEVQAEIRGLAGAK